MPTDIDLAATEDVIVTPELPEPDELAEPDELPELSDIGDIEPESEPEAGRPATTGPVLQYVGMADKAGTPFDPAKHSYNPVTGEPTRTKTGNWRKKRGAKATAETPQLDASPLYLANVCTDGFLGVGQIGFGDSFAPTDRAERERIVSAFETYFRAKDIKDLPPGLALVAALGMYTMNKALQPPARTTFKQRFGGKVRAIWGRIRRRKPNPTTEPENGQESKATDTD